MGRRRLASGVSAPAGALSMRGCAPHCRRRKVRSAPFPSPSQAPHPSFRPCWPDLAHFAAPALPTTQAWRGPQCENCARSLAPQGHFRAHSVGLGAPPLPTARGAAGAPLRDIKKKMRRARWKRKMFGGSVCAGADLLPPAGEGWRSLAAVRDGNARPLGKPLARGSLGYILR